MPTLNKTLAIFAGLAFALSFIAISCNGRTIPGTEVSGFKLAQCAVSTCTTKDLFTPKAITSALPINKAPQMPAGKPLNTGIMNFVLFAGFAAVFAAAILFWPGRTGELLSAVASVASIVLLLVFRSKLLDAVAPELHSPTMGTAGLVLQIELQFSSGFWLSILASAGSAILAFRGTHSAQTAAPPGAAATSRSFAPPPSAGASASSGGQMGTVCPSCGANNTEESKFCLTCGGSLAPPVPAAQTMGSGVVIFCSSCHAANPLENKFCLKCGGSLAAPVQTSSSPQSSGTPPGSAPSGTSSGNSPVALAAAAAGSAISAGPPISAQAPAAPDDQPGGDTSWMKAATGVAVGVAAAVAPAKQASQERATTVVDSAPTVATAIAKDREPRASQQTSSEPVCTGCGAPISSDAKFCLACGAPVSVASATATSTSAATIHSADQPAEPQAQPFQSPAGAAGKMWLLVVLLVGVLSVAGWFIWKHFAGPDVTVNTFPQRTHVAAGGRTIFQATVSGSNDADVVWTIQEGASGGQIKPQGTIIVAGQARASALYTAPLSSGAYHVIATSHANSSRSAKIEVVVGGASQPNNSVTGNQPAVSTPATAANTNAAQVVGNWRGPTTDMTTTIGADGSITMNSDADPHKNLKGTYKFSDSSHLSLDFGNGDARRWEILAVTSQYLRVLSQSKTETAALIFMRM